MPDAAQAVSQAIYTAVAAAVAPTPVFDFVPEDQVYPFVDITMIQERPVLTGATATPLAGDFAEYIVYLTVWSSYRGKKEVLAINGQIRDALHNAKLALSAGVCTLCQVTSAEARPDADGLTHQGAVTVRLLVSN